VAGWTVSCYTCISIGAKWESALPQKTPKTSTETNLSSQQQQQLSPIKPHQQKGEFFWKEKRSHSIIHNLLFHVLSNTEIKQLNFFFPK